MKVYRDKEGNELAICVPFVLDGLAFAANWLELANPEDLKARGITVSVETDQTPAEPPTPTEKLQAIGLSVDDLKRLLAS